MCVGKARTGPAPCRYRLGNPGGISRLVEEETTDRISNLVLLLIRKFHMWNDKADSVIHHNVRLK